MPALTTEGFLTIHPRPEDVKAEIPRDSEEREASVLARSNHPADLYRSPHEIDDSHQQYATRIIEHAEELVGALRCVHSGRAIFAEQLHFRRHP